MMRRSRVVLVLAALMVLGLAAELGIARWKRRLVPEGAPTPAPEGADWVDLLDAAHAPG